MLQRAPRRYVAVVVELRDHDLVMLPPATPERSRDVEGDRRHVRAEGNLLGRAVDERREELARP